MFPYIVGIFFFILWTVPYIVDGSLYCGWFLILWAVSFIDIMEHYLELYANQRITFQDSFDGMLFKFFSFAKDCQHFTETLIFS